MHAMHLRRRRIAERLLEALPSSPNSETARPPPHPAPMPAQNNAQNANSEQARRRPDRHIRRSRLRRIVGQVVA